MLETIATHDPGMEGEQEIGEADEDGGSLGAFSGPVAASLAVGLFLWQGTRAGGWLEAAFGEFASPFWGAVILWLVVSAFAVRAHQHWWVMLTAPFALYPVAMAALIMAECLQGNCL